MSRARVSSSALPPKNGPATLKDPGAKAASSRPFADSTTNRLLYSTINNPPKSRSIWILVPSTSVGCPYDWFIKANGNLSCEKSYHFQRVLSAVIVIRKSR